MQCAAGRLSGCEESTHSIKQIRRRSPLAAAQAVRHIIFVKVMSTFGTGKK